MLDVASLEGDERVEQWRGRLLDGLGRLWVGISEAESLPGVDGRGDFEALKGRIGEVLKVVLKCAPELSVRRCPFFLRAHWLRSPHLTFSQDDLEDLVQLDSKMFAELLALL